jgi:hypothetical protein
MGGCTANPGNPSLPHGIEALVTKNRYYRPMRERTALVLGTILAGAVLGMGARRPGPQVAPAPASESHDGITITAQPWTEPTSYRANFPKKNPLSGGIVAIHITILNDSAETLRVNLDRIRLVVTLGEDSRQNLPPLSSEDVADVVLRSKPRDTTRSRARIPIPLGKSKASRNKEWMEFEQAARDAGVPSSVIAGQSKLQGLLYFDLANQFDLVRTARLYVPELTVLEKGKSLLYFEIDLSKSAAM